MEYRFKFSGGVHNVGPHTIVLSEDQYIMLKQGKDWDEVLTFSQWSELDNHFCPTNCGCQSWYLRKNIKIKEVK
jgi:hypothetical protein